MARGEDYTVNIEGSDRPRFKSFPSYLLTNPHGQGHIASLSFTFFFSKMRLITVLITVNIYLRVDWMRHHT